MFGSHPSIACLIVFIARLIAVTSQEAQADVTSFDLPRACQAPAAIAASSIGIPEAEGRGSALSLWALFFVDPVTVERRVKIAWRVTGSGIFRVTALSPSGLRIKPLTDPVAHTGSNWQRPGDEWGTFFVFPARGCWDLRVSRGDASADLWIDVK
jgi:hypothetical protein